MDERLPGLVAHLLLLICLSSGLARADFEETPDYVAAYAPLLWLHSDDPYMPSDILSHIRHTTPMLQGEPVADDLQDLGLDNLEALNQYGDQVALTSNEDVTTLPPWIFGQAPDQNGTIHNATPSIVILVEKGRGLMDAFFFYFYSYNEGLNITQVMEPLNGLVSGPEAESGMHFGNHVGDWEHNMIRFRDGKPKGIYYSQHEGGKAYHWDDAAVSKAGDRPIVYSARGSHANYAGSGEQVHDAALIDYCDAGQQWDPLTSAKFYSLDSKSFTLTRLKAPGQGEEPFSSLNETSFFYFRGRWGDAQYPDADPRQRTVPYIGSRRFLKGPTGPRDKQLLRKDLMPLERHTETWIEWVLKTYMEWYPCCLKGWRFWVFIGIVILILVGLGVGIFMIIKRCRKTSYQQLGQEEFALESWEEEGQASFSLLSTDGTSDD